MLILLDNVALVGAARGRLCLRKERKYRYLWFDFDVSMKNYDDWVSLIFAA
jgi:hypothetical protein